MNQTIYNAIYVNMKWTLTVFFLLVLINTINYIYLLSYNFELEKLNEPLWTCSLHIVGNLLKDSTCVLYLLLQVSDSSFVSLRRASNLSSDNCADASLLSIINSLFHWLLFSYNTWEQTIFQNKIVNQADLKLRKSPIF